MDKLYMAFGVAICSLMVYANSVGWTVMDFGAPTASRTGPGQHYYHK